MSASDNLNILMHFAFFDTRDLHKVNTCLFVKQEKEQLYLLGIMGGSPVTKVIEFLSAVISGGFWMLGAAFVVIAAIILMPSIDYSVSNLFNPSHLIVPLLFGGAQGFRKFFVHVADGYWGFLVRYQSLLYFNQVTPHQMGRVLGKKRVHIFRYFNCNSTNCSCFMKVILFQKEKQHLSSQTTCTYFTLIYLLLILLLDGELIGSTSSV